MPEAYRTAGVADADIVVFLTARPIASYGAAGDTIAYAGHCEADQHGRPISAHFNWSPRTLSPPSDEWLEGYLLRVALHELTHALVFTPELINYFPSPQSDGQSYVYGGGLRYLPAPAGMRAHIATPKVSLAVQKHFACASLRGARPTSSLRRRCSRARTFCCLS